MQALAITKLIIYWTKKKRISISMGNLIIVKTAPRNCLVWVKSEICYQSSFANQKFIVAFCSVLQNIKQTIKCSKFNGGCDKPCASCTSLHLSGMNRLRWVILACGMSSHTSWITAYNCTLVFRLETGQFNTHASVTHTLKAITKVITWPLCTKQ